MVNSPKGGWFQRRMKMDNNKYVWTMVVLIVCSIMGALLSATYLAEKESSKRYAICVGSGGAYLNGSCIFSRVQARIEENVKTGIPTKVDH
jgi:hypothetical protein